MQEARQVQRLPFHKKYERMQRAAIIKLIDINGYNYTVLGSTGKVYTISINDTKLNCNCIDCKRTGQYCKHIYFIFNHVYEIREINQLAKDYTIDEIKSLHDTFLTHKTQPKKKARNEQEDCPICFECNSGTSFVCGTCENGFHSLCIQTMLQFSNKCPMCRSLIMRF